MATVRDILRTKGSQVWTMGPTETVYDGLVRLALHDIGALVVLDQGKIVGIFSERDYARKVALMGRASKDTQIQHIMTRAVMTATEDWDVERCMKTMTAGRFRHLPVVKNERLIGVISIGDVVSNIISKQRYMIDQLTHYMQVGMG